MIEIDISLCLSARPPVWNFTVSKRVGGKRVVVKVASRNALWFTNYVFTSTFSDDRSRWPSTLFESSRLNDNVAF